MNQPMNPGAGRIERIKKMTQLPPPKLRLELSIVAARTEQGKGVQTRLTVRNNSDETIELTPDELALILVSREAVDPVGRQRTQAGRSFWYYRYAFPLGEPRPHVACHEVVLPWTPQEYVRNSDQVEVGERKPTGKDPGTYEPLVLKPGGSFHTETMVGEELGAGQYELFFYRRSGNLSHEPQGMSDRAAFDVVPPRN
jgi:hypothetical protein